MPGGMLAEHQSLHPTGPGNTLACQEHCISSSSQAEAALSSFTEGRKENESLRLADLSPVWKSLIWHLVVFFLHRRKSVGAP